MKQKKLKIYDNRKISLCITTFLIIFLFGLILPKNANADTEQKSQNFFYIKAINNTLALLNSSSNGGQEVNSEIEYSVLSFLGINIFNPITIITKQISYLNKNEASTNTNNASAQEKIIDAITPFDLTQSQVSNLTEPTDVAIIPSADLKQTLNEASPRVFIYHTHATESYLTSNTDTTKSTFSTDETRNVVGVGDIIETELEKTYGISVIHDKTLHNLLDYTNSYKKSAVTLDKYLKEFGDLDLIIDLHRDGAPVNNKNAITTKIDGKDAAKIMFVVTKGNPRYAKQKVLVDSMVGISNKLFPGFLHDKHISVMNRGLDFYNQNRSDNAVLIEVGNNNNTVEQVKNTGICLSRIFAQQLNGKSK